MALTYAYHDAYLAPLVTADRETRALADVNTIAEFGDDWIAKLTVVRAYVLVCLESQKAPDDLFAAKLSAYRKEWDALLSQAKANTTDNATGQPIPAFSIAIERG